MNHRTDVPSQHTAAARGTCPLADAVIFDSSMTALGPRLVVLTRSHEAAGDSNGDS